MLRVIKDKNLKHQLFSLIIPFVIQELVVVLTTVLNTILLGASGENGSTIAAISFAFQIYFFFNTVVLSMVFAGALFVSQHYGAKQLDEVQKDYHLLLKLAVFASLIFTIICLIIPDKLISIFAAGNIDCINAGKNYLKIFSISFIPTSISMVNYLLIKNVKLQKIGSASSFQTFFLTLLFDSIFLFGCKNTPIGGAVGGASAIVIARGVELITTTLIIKLKSPVKFSFNSLKEFDIKRLKSFFRYGAPMMIGKISWSLGFLFVTIFISNIVSPDINAIVLANQLMLTGENLAMCINTGISGAIGVIIGRELGANNLEQASKYGDDLTLFIFLTSLFNMAIFLILLPIVPYVNHGAVDELTKDYLWKFFLIQSVMFIPRAYNAAYENGIFNAGGEQVHVALVDGIPWWVSILPLAAIGIWQKWDPLVIFTILQLEELVKCPFNVIKYKKKTWVKDIVKQRQELVK